MNGLSVATSTRNLLFTDAGTVVDSATGAALGRWSAETSNVAQENCFIYDLGGTLQPALRVRYQFNASNQLVVAVQKSDGVATADATCIFPGEIAVDDDHDVVYSITNGPGSLTGQSVVVYGDLAFNGPVSLVLQLVGGGQTAITADPLTPLSATQNLDPDKAGNDLMTFNASTTNTYAANGGATENRPATIALAGRWQLAPDGVAFAASVDGDLSNPSLVLNLRGQCKAVAAGLEFRLDDKQITALFVIDGQHRFDGGSAAWELSIGYSQQADPSLRVTATAKGAISYTTAAGNKLTINGTLAYKGDGTAQGGTLTLGIDAEYVFKGGQLFIKANASKAGSTVKYDLQISGKIQVRGGTLVFDVSYDSTNVTTLNVKYAGTDSDFFKNFNVGITTDATGKVTATVSFSLSLTYVNGVQVVAKQ